MKAEPAAQAQARVAYGRVVVDTNVLLSAALSPAGTPAKLLDTLLQVGRLVFCEATFQELKARIWLPKFDRYLSIERRQAVLRDASAAALWVDIRGELSTRKFSRDADDDAFIRAAIAAGAPRLVTGDDDLLCLHPLDSLHIVSPRAALDELERPAPSPG